MTSENHAISNARAWLEEIHRMVAATAIAADAEDWRAEDQAREEITQSALSVLVRGGWRVPGGEDEGPEEYEILLSTGGPALRIYGALNGYGEPDDSPALQWQDWGTPWTDYPLDAEESAAVLAYAREFYFGE
jgi:hypothetical protein